jgi:hypothetical protein
MEEMINYLDKQVDHPLSMNQIFNISVINGLWTLISGSKFELDDPRLIKLIQYMDLAIKLSGNTGVLTIFPWLRDIAPQMCG